MKFKILYESYDDKGTYGFLTKSSFSEFKKVTKKLVALLDKYDKVIDELEAKADSEGKQELLEKDAYYNSLIKAYSNSYETILSLDNAFKNNYIKVDTFHPSDEVVVDLSIYKVEDLYDLLYDLQDTLSKSNNLDEGLNTRMKFLVENELEKRHKKHKKTLKPGAMGWFVHPDGGNQVAIDSFNNSVDTGAASSACGLGEAYVLDSEEEWAEDNKLVRTDLYTKVYGGKLSHVYKSEIDGRLYALEYDPSSEGYRYVGTFREYCDEITPEVTQRLVAQRMLEDLGQNGGWEDPEWRKYWGVDDDSFYDDYEEEPLDESTIDGLYGHTYYGDSHNKEFVEKLVKNIYPDFESTGNVNLYSTVRLTFEIEPASSYDFFKGRKLKKILQGIEDMNNSEDFTFALSKKQDVVELEITVSKYNLLNVPKEVKSLYESLDEDYYGGLPSEPSASDESLKEDKEIFYIIKDRQGHQLSSPNSDDNELWDRVDSMDPYGKKGYRVVVYTGESLTEDYDRAIKDLESIERFLRREGFDSYDVTDYDEYPMETSVISFEIEGDWKHEHLFFENLIEEWAEENNRDIFKIDSETVGSPDSDYYTAIHTVYITRDHEATNMLNSMRGLFAESLTEDYDINEKRADFLRAIHLCKQYDPYTQYIDSYNQQKAAERRNDELSKEFDEIMHKYGINSDGIHSYFTKADCKTDRDYIEALKQYIEFCRKK